MFLYQALFVNKKSMDFRMQSVLLAYVTHGYGLFNTVFCTLRFEAL